MVTNAGLLLCDQGYIRQSKIVCTRWKGLEKGSVDGDALDDQEFSESSIITLLNDAESFIRNNSKKAWTIRGMRREEKSDYPFKEVREVLQVWHSWNLSFLKKLNLELRKLNLRM